MKSVFSPRDSFARASLRCVFGIAMASVAFSSADAQETPGSGATSSATEQRLPFTLEEQSAARGIGLYRMALPGMGGGMNVVDIDNDGDVDIFVPNGQGAANQLYINDSHGFFLESAKSHGLDATRDDRAALIIDIDGDRRREILTFNDDLNLPSFITCYKQLPDGTFIDVTKPCGLIKRNDPPGALPGHIGGSAAADINNDGYLDFYVALWGESNSLFLNRGDGTFEDISLSSGTLGPETGLHWQPIFHDFDDDGWMDLYVNVDEGNNVLYLNRGDLTFAEVAGDVGAAPHMNCMGIASVDLEGDGDFDFFISNVWEFEQEGEHDVLLESRRQQTGSILFRDVAYSQRVVTKDNWGWGCTFADLDNDGSVELAETNGWVSPPWNRDPTRLFRRRAGSGPFVDVAAQTGFHHREYGSCLVAADIDRDGRPDLLETVLQGAVRLYVNRLRPGADEHGYLVVKPRLPDSPNFRAIGAVVHIDVAGRSQGRLITAGTSLLGQEPAEAMFGLGGASHVDEVRVEFPDGRVVVQHDVSPNQVLVVTP